MKKTQNTILAFVILLSNLLNAQIETLHPDFSNAYLIENKQSHTFSKVADAGEDKNEIKSSTCLPDINFETHSTWLKLKIQTEGSLAFDIVPLQKEDDFDFIVYRIHGKEKAETKEEIRCMASGEVIGAPENSATCKGLTGLSSIAKDQAETRGCANNKDNFLSAINAQTYEEYAICINNFNSNEGFTIHFTGTSQFISKQEPQLTVSECMPNPSRDQTRINISTPNNNNLTYTIFAANGAVITSHQKQILLRGNNPIEIETQQLPQGAYKIQLLIGDKIFERSLVKQ